MFEFYTYVYLNPLKSGKYNFGKFNFNYEPFYIGKGKGNRYLEHLKINKRRINRYKQNIINDIIKNNKKPIIIKLYDNITEHSAFRLEKILINIIGRLDKGTGTLSNLTDGGDGISGTLYTKDKRINMIRNKSKIVQYNNEGKILKIWDNIVDISIQYPYILTNNLHRVCKSKGHRKLDNYFWKYYNNEKITDIINIIDKYKPILQYDLDGNFIKIWDSSSEISKSGYSSGAVLKCCRNNNNNNNNILYFKFNNFMWFFKNGNILSKIDKYENKMSKGSNLLKNKNIKMYDLKNNLLGIFTPKELKVTGFLTKTIYRCCNGELKTTQGFKWEWE